MARGHRVTILCAAHDAAPARQRTPEGVEIVRRGGRKTVYAMAALTYLAGALGVGPLSRRALGRPDAIVDVGNGLPFLSAAYARRPVVALVHHVHREQWPVVLGRLGAKFGWWVESKLAIRVYRDCRYVTVSAATAGELTELGVDADRISIVHNGTPPVPDAVHDRDPEPHLVVLGRLVPHKRVEIALRTVAALRPGLPGLRLTVAGKGWWEPNLRQLAVELGIADAVRFAGFITEDEKHRLLSEAWVALTPSLKEGWGLTIVEAGARRTPTVAFADAGGVTEALVDRSTGLLATDEAHFIELVRQLMTDDDRRLAMGADAELHAKSFTWQTSGTRFAALLAPQAEPRRLTETAPVTSA
ncbi:glycosyltransferase involved in cell wall biosynthesis [Allocatelliglobosispora scoriae]|uniref:Glycosyltransferase involved in cell wall biosynthesis n=1 Tax=Allocatelliglobosispora scoriae TaxID=643052 RepID=A0A841BSQ1_9ACTN|nr:glycosyltransferase involved in cell wall biosynthesis [Allocatelliglobosispora scoriae]